MAFSVFASSALRKGWGVAVQILSHFLDCRGMNTESYSYLAKTNGKRVCLSEWGFSPVFGPYATMGG